MKHVEQGTLAGVVLLALIRQHARGARPSLQATLWDIQDFCKGRAREEHGRDRIASSVPRPAGWVPLVRRAFKDYREAAHYWAATVLSHEDEIPDLRWPTRDDELIRFIDVASIIGVIATRVPMKYTKFQPALDYDQALHLRLPLRYASPRGIRMSPELRRAIGL